MRIAIIAALRGELAPLVRGWKQQPADGEKIQMWVKSGDGDEVIALCAGMGAEPARRSFAAAEAHGPLDRVLSVGWAGSLNEAMQPGTCYVPSEVIDAQTGERFSLTAGKRTQRLVTTARVVDTEEKHRLSETYGAVLVDMEAAPLARLAQMRGLPFACFKAVSDGPAARLPDLNPFIDPRGQLRMLPFLGHVAVRPRYWKPLADLGTTSAKAARQLARTIELFLVTKDLEKVNRTGTLD